MNAIDSEVWQDTCAWCGMDLPLTATANQKFCCPECRHAAGEEKRQAHNLTRRKVRARIREERERAPCPGCGAVIPAGAPLNKVYCSDPCQRRHYTALRTQRLREERLAARQARRDAREEQGQGAPCGLGSAKHLG